MAKVKEGSRSQLSGKADGLVYVQAKWGVHTRRLPRKKKESWTPGMLRNLERFKRVNEFCSLFKNSLIPQIWKGVNPRMSGYALFLKSNMPAFAPDGSIRDAKMISLSTGNLSFSEGFEARRSEGDQTQIEVSWPREMNVGGVHLKDELMVVSAVEGKYSELMASGIERNQLGGSFALPALPLPIEGAPMLVYLLFASANRRDYSPSKCFEL